MAHLETKVRLGDSKRFSNSCRNFDGEELERLRKIFSWTASLSDKHTLAHTHRRAGIRCQGKVWMLATDCGKFSWMCRYILTWNHMVRVAGCVARVRLVVVQIVDLRAVLVSEIQLGSAVIQGWRDQIQIIRMSMKKAEKEKKRAKGTLFYYLRILWNLRH